MDSIVEKIAAMSALELVKLKNALAEKLGIDMSAMSFGASGGNAAAASEAEAAPSKVTVWGIKLDESKKNSAIKFIKDALGIGLLDAKGVVDKIALNGKSEIAKDKTPAEAAQLKKDLEAVGIETEIK